MKKEGIQTRKRKPKASVAGQQTNSLSQSSGVSDGLTSGSSKSGSSKFCNLTIKPNFAYCYL